ncbi:MAG: hypothetical protein AAGF53_18700 [Pseudomonadota bacterium]
MSQDPQKPPRIHLGPIAEAFLEEHAPDVSGGLAKRLDAALETVLNQAAEEAGSDVQEPGEEMPNLWHIETQIDDRAAMQDELIKDGFTSITRQLTALKSELHDTHTTINVLRSFLVMVVAALRDEDLTEQTEMVMAEIDALITPMKAKSYDPARTRRKRREQRELAERQMSPTANEPVLASGNQFEQTNDGERER